MLRFLALNTGARRDFVPFRQPPPPHPLFSLRSQTATSQIAGFRNSNAGLSLGMLFFTHRTSSASSPSHIRRIPSRRPAAPFFSWKWSHLRSECMIHICSVKAWFPTACPSQMENTKAMYTRGVSWVKHSSQKCHWSISVVKLSCQSSSTKPLWGLSGCPISTRLPRF